MISENHLFIFCISGFSLSLEKSKLSENGPKDFPNEIKCFLPVKP